MITMHLFPYKMSEKSRYIYSIKMKPFFKKYLVFTVRHDIKIFWLQFHKIKDKDGHT